jgi:hypothetical protein
LESSSSSSSSFRTGSLSRFFGRGDAVLREGADVDDVKRAVFKGGCCNAEEEEDLTTAGAGLGLEDNDNDDGPDEDEGVFVIFFSDLGDAGATPLGRPLCLARSARARFIVLCALSSKCQCCQSLSLTHKNGSDSSKRAPRRCKCCLAVAAAAFLLLVVVFTPGLAVSCCGSNNQ